MKKAETPAAKGVYFKIPNGTYNKFCELSGRLDLDMTKIFKHSVHELYRQSEILKRLERGEKLNSQESDLLLRLLWVFGGSLPPERKDNLLNQLINNAKELGLSAEELTTVKNTLS